jgi:hypothetical protein
MHTAPLTLTDSKGCTYEVTFYPPTPHRTFERGPGFIQGILITSDHGTTKHMALQPDQVVALNACHDKTSWSGWEAMLAQVE